MVTARKLKFVQVSKGYQTGGSLVGRVCYHWNYPFCLAGKDKPIKKYDKQLFVEYILMPVQCFKLF